MKRVVDNIILWLFWSIFFKSLRDRLFIMGYKQGKYENKLNSAHDLMNLFPGGYNYEVE